MGRVQPAKHARVLNEWITIRANADDIARDLSLEHGKTFADAHGDLQRGLGSSSSPRRPALKGGSRAVGTGVDVRPPAARRRRRITPFSPAMIPCGRPARRWPRQRSSQALRADPCRHPGQALPRPAARPACSSSTAPTTSAACSSTPTSAIGFVGSTPVAEHVYVTSAKLGKRAQCFGGAKNHMIIMPDADLDRVVDALIGAAYGSAGERCMAISVAVPIGDEVADALRDALVERIKDLKVGHSLDPDASYGPLITPQALERVRDTSSAEGEGATLVIDGRDVGATDDEFEGESLADGLFIGPSLIDDVKPGMRCYDEEIFGPVLCIARAKDYEEALALPNEHEYGNGVAIFTRDGDAARDFASRVEVGMVGVNVPIPVPVAFHTFGGWKRSGFGDLNQHGPDAFRFYTRTKTITTTWPKGPREGASFNMPVLGS